MADAAHRWNIPEMIATISNVRPVPRAAGQTFGGVAISDTVRLNAARFATALHADYRQYVGPPQITATVDGGIAFRWRRNTGPSAEPVDVEIVFVHNETEYAVTPVGDADNFIDEGATQSAPYLLREVVKRYLVA